MNNLIAAKGRMLRRHGVAPLGSEFIVILATLFSLLFILSASLAFVNPEVGPLFKDTLNSLSAQQDGIILLGEDVDVDIDEPSVTIRWTVLGCGQSFFMTGSPKLHDSAACGAPSIPLDIFIDSSDAPSFTYDPAKIPTSQKTSQRVIVQSQVQFDSDHVLDVHNSRLYPYDTYLLSTSLRATTSNTSVKDVPIDIVGLPVIEYTSSFFINSADTDVLLTVDEDINPGKHVDMRIRRPGHARMYAMLIFGINWALCHFSLGIVLLSLMQGRRSGRAEVLKQLAGAHAVMFVIPQLRSAMPDAPGFDGVLIDTIGFFPQMALAGISAVLLMLILVKRELDDNAEGASDMPHRKPSPPGYEPLELYSNSQEDDYSSPDSRARLSRDKLLGHGRQVSARDVLLERAMRVVDAGSQVFRNSSLGTSRGHVRSRSHHERKIV